MGQREQAPTPPPGAAERRQAPLGAATAFFYITTLFFRFVFFQPCSNVRKNHIASRAREPRVTSHQSLCPTPICLLCRLFVTLKNHFFTSLPSKSGILLFLHFKGFNNLFLHFFCLLAVDFLQIIAFSHSLPILVVFFAQHTSCLVEWL